MCNSITINNLENQTDREESGKASNDGDVNNTVLSSPVPKIQTEECKTRNTEIQKEVKIRAQKSRKEVRRIKREDKRAKKKSGSGSTPIVLPPPQMFEEETRMSATESNSRSQTPARATGSYLIMTFFLFD